MTNLVNGINKAAIDGAVAKMKEDPSFAAKAPASMTAVWNPNTGLVTSPAFDSLQMQSFLEVSTLKDPSIPSILDYCPLMGKF
jgi:hypothetical protein